MPSGKYDFREQNGGNQMISNNDFWADAEVISTYTRKQAIEDGVLVDLMQDELGSLVREAGFLYPIAMTSTAFAEAIYDESGKDLPYAEAQAKRLMGWSLLPEGQDIKGRLWDVLTVLRVAIKRQTGPTTEIPFAVKVWDGRKHKTVRLKSVCGPGDNMEPVITIMLPNED